MPSAERIGSIHRDREAIHRHSCHVGFSSSLKYCTPKRQTSQSVSQSVRRLGWVRVAVTVSVHVHEVQAACGAWPSRPLQLPHPLSDSKKCHSRKLGPRKLGPNIPNPAFRSARQAQGAHGRHGTASLETRKQPNYLGPRSTPNRVMSHFLKYCGGYK